MTDLMQPLLDIFTGVKVHILPNTPNAPQLERYFTAYVINLSEAVACTCTLYVIPFHFS